MDSLNDLLIEHHNNRVYLYKDDVWAHAPTGMTSASRDIFDFYYRAIKYTFNEQFNNNEIKTLSKKIMNVRNWFELNSSCIAQSANKKDANYTLIPYIESEAEFPIESEWSEDYARYIVPDESLFDKKIYTNFEDFFENANHGYNKTAGGRVVCQKIWSCFIQDISVEKLQKVLKLEIEVANAWIKIDEAILKIYLDQGSADSWFNFVSKKMDLFSNIP